MPAFSWAGLSHPGRAGHHAGASGGRQEGAEEREPREARQRAPCNEAADDGFTSSITLCGAYVYVVATSIKRGQISCVCAAAKLVVVTFPSASLLYNPLLPLKLRARKKSPLSLLLDAGAGGAARPPAFSVESQSLPSNLDLKSHALPHGLGLLCSQRRAKPLSELVYCSVRTGSGKL